MNQSRPTPPPRKPLQRPDTVPVPPAAGAPGAGSGNRAIVIGFLAGVATCVVVSMIVGLVYLSVFARNDRAQDVDLTQTVSEPRPQIDPSATQSVEADRATKELTVDEKPDNESRQSSETESNEEPDATEPDDGAPPEPVSQPDPLYDVIVEQESRLMLPPLNPEEREAGSEHLATIYVDDPSDVELDLVGWERVLNEGHEYRCEVEEDRRGARHWSIVEVVPRISTQTPIGEFVLYDQQLSFEWARNVAASQLQYCLLKIHVGDTGEEGEAVCALIIPAYQEAIPLSFDPYAYTVRLNTQNQLPSLDSLELKLALRGLADDTWGISRTTLRPGTSETTAEPVTLSFLDPFDEPGSLLHIDVSFIADGTSPPHLHFQNKAQPLDVFEGREQNISIGGRAISVPGALEIRRTAEPLSFARSAFDGVREQIETKLALYQRTLATLPATIRRLMDAIAQLRRQTAELRSDPDENRRRIAQAESALEEFQAFVSEVESLQDEQYPQAIAYCESREEWLKNLEEYYRELESSVKIDVELYVDVGEHRVPILRTVEADSSAEDTADAVSSAYIDPFSGRENHDE